MSLKCVIVWDLFYGGKQLKKKIYLNLREKTTELKYLSICVCVCISF